MSCNAGVKMKGGKYSYVAPIELLDTNKYTMTTVSDSYDGNKTSTYDISNVDFIVVRFTQMSGPTWGYLTDSNGNTLQIYQTSAWGLNTPYNVSPSGVVDVRGFSSLSIVTRSQRNNWSIDEYVKN